MRQFMSRSHPWIMQAVGGLIGVIVFIPIAAWAYITFVNNATVKSVPSLAPPAAGPASSGQTNQEPNSGGVHNTGGGQPPASSTPSSSGGAVATNVTWATVHTIFATNCTPCHVGGQLGGLSLDTYAGALKGGSTAAGGPVNGAVIKPGDAAGSYMYQVITGKQQPQMPLGRTPLPQSDIQTIYNWIQGGAKS